MNQHTGNWPGKTVNNSSGSITYKDKQFLLTDIPGTYSLISDSSEEEIARNYICFGNVDVTVVVTDSTCLERNLNLVYQILELTKNVIVCVNLLDEANKKHIDIDLNGLSDMLGVPVVGTIGVKPKTLKTLLDTIYNVCVGTLECTPKLVLYPKVIEESISLLTSEIKKVFDRNIYIHRWIALKLIDDNRHIVNEIEKHLNINLLDNFRINTQLENVQDLLLECGITSANFKDKIISSILFKCEDVSNDIVSYKRADYNLSDRKIDNILTSKILGFPIMIAFLGLIFWITITLANYPSSILFSLFNFIENKLLLLCELAYFPAWLSSVLVLRDI